MGKPAVPGLVDNEGAMWHSVEEVVAHAKPEEVYAEIKAQLDRARLWVLPQRMSTTIWARCLGRCLFTGICKLGVENHIPVDDACRPCHTNSGANEIP